MMRTAWGLVSSEAIKLRRTPALWISVAVPALAFGLELIALLDLDNSFPRGDANAAWRSLLQGGWGVWLVLAAPMLISVEAASLPTWSMVGALETTVRFPDTAMECLRHENAVLRTSGGCGLPGRRSGIHR